MINIFRLIYSVSVQVVNAAVKEALDEFVMKWVAEDIQRLLGSSPEAITGATMQTSLEATGQNLWNLCEKLAELVLHFVNVE